MKRTLSVFLSIALCLSLLPTAAMAETNTSGTELTASTTTLTDGDYYLSEDVNLTTTLEVNGTVNLYLNGHMLKGTAGNDVIRTTAGAVLNLYDDIDSTITHEVYPVYAEDTVMTVKGGLITGGGRGIQITGGSAVHMHGGTIACNGIVPGENFGYMGGGVLVGGEFEMDGGTICNNIAGYGGGVYVSGASGHFLIKDGVICNNLASLQGGGVFVGGGIAEIENSEISGNSIPSRVDSQSRSGGGIFASGGKLNVSGSKIKNSTAQFGGGIYIGGSCEASMSGSEISNNKADASGGGVYLQDTGTFSMQSGSISKNQSEGDGGGVGMRGSSKFNFADGEISYNHASSVGGGGVNLNGSPEFVMRGGKIHNNTTDGYGGGIGASSNKSLTVEGDSRIDQTQADCKNKRYPLQS